jgi:hypothetical protein
VLTPDGTSPGDLFGELLEHRQTLAEHRVELAGDAAGALVDALIAAAPGRSDDDIEDDFCVRFGAAMTDFDEGSVEDFVNPADLVHALLSALDGRLHDAEQAGSDVTAHRRVLAVVAGVLPAPLGESVRGPVSAHLDARTARRVLRGRAVAGPVLWARDVYGSRWAVVAPFTSVDGPDRWYLWDVDACGYEVVTVGGGFYPSDEAAVAAWRESVGPEAAGHAVLAAVDDSELLGALLRGEVEGIRMGGEDEAQYAEFLRSRRLGRTVREAVRRVRGRTSVRLTADEATVRFADRLRQIGYHDGILSDGEDAGPVGADELAAEMADSWPPHHHPALYPSCSPHKVAMTVLHLRDYFKDDFAAKLIAVLPEWIRFLAEHTSTPAEVTERCLAYASGERQFPGILDDDGQSNPMACVTE